MSAAYQHLALSEVKPGMILSDELLDKQGQVLLPKGAVLTSKTIALLPGHGIDIGPGHGSDAREVLDRVERRALGSEHRAGVAGEAHEIGAGGDGTPLLRQQLDPHHSRGVRSHFRQPPRAVRRHRDMIFLIGRRR